MGTPTYTALANITLGSNAASVTFSSISQAYRDLVLVIDFAVASASNIKLNINSDTGANYSQVVMSGNGSTASSGVGSGQTTGYLIFNDTPTSGNRYQSIANFLDYSATDKHKTTLVRGNSAATITEANAIRWASTSAITSFVIAGTGGQFTAGSTFALYGIAA